MRPYLVYWFKAAFHITPWAAVGGFGAPKWLCIGGGILWLMLLEKRGVLVPPRIERRGSDD